VVEAFTYFGHRQKLRVVGKEDILEPLNWQALSVAGVARQTGTLLGATSATPTSTSRGPWPCRRSGPRSRSRWRAAEAGAT
jgi:hypothetical protein